MRSCCQCVRRLVFPDARFPVFFRARLTSSASVVQRSKLPVKMEVNPPKQEHLLALKVMRLTKPTLFTNIPVTCEEKDLPGDLFNQLMRDDPSTVKGAEILMLGEMLTLPQNFGNIFLGETFSSYISVHNDSNQVVKDILVKADLQTSSQRLNLSASNAAVAELKPD